MAQKKTEINPIEQYFEWYLQELKDFGYIKDFFREPETLVVAYKTTANKILRKKSIDKIVEIPLFPEIVLTYDYLIIWDKKAEYYFYECIEPHNILFQLGMPLFIAHQGHLKIRGEDYDLDDTIYSYVDVKTLTCITQFGGNSSSYTFPIKQRMLYDTFGIYVNKIIPVPAGKKGINLALFHKSFIPSRYLLTDKNVSARKINFSGQPLLTYLHLKSQEILEMVNNGKRNK